MSAQIYRWNRIFNNILDKQFINFYGCTNSKNIDIEYEKTVLLLCELFNFANKNPKILKYFEFNPRDLFGNYYYTSHNEKYCSILSYKQNNYKFKSSGVLKVIDEKNYFADHINHTAILLEAIKYRYQWIKEVDKINWDNNNDKKDPATPHDPLNITNSNINKSSVINNLEIEKILTESINNSKIKLESKSNLTKTTSKNPDNKITRSNDSNTTNKNAISPIKAKEIGLIGEDIVYKFEEKKIKLNYPIRIGELIHISKVKGDGYGYDIESWEGTRKIYIEVKTTTGGLNNAFVFTENELRFAEKAGEQFQLHIIYNLQIINTTPELNSNYNHQVIDGFEKFKKLFLSEVNEIYLVPKSKIS